MKALEKNIRKTGLGDYIVTFGYTMENIECEYKPGFYMNGFIVYQSSRHDTLEEAEKATYRK